MNPITIIGNLSIEEQQNVLFNMEELLKNHFSSDDGPNWDTACDVACVDIRRHNATRELDENYAQCCWTLEYRIIERINGSMRKQALAGNIKAAALVLGTKVQISTPVARMPKAVKAEVSNVEKVTTTTTVTQQVTKKEEKLLASQPDKLVADFLNKFKSPDVIDVPFEIIKPKDKEDV